MKEAGTLHNRRGIYPIRLIRKIDNNIQHIWSLIEKKLKLKIKGKLGVAFVGFSSIPMVVIGIILWYLNMQSMRSTATTDLSHATELITIRLKEFTEVVQTDLELINTNFKTIVTVNKNSEIPNKTLSLFKEQLQNLMKTKPQYYRLTFLVDSLQSQLFSFKRDLNNRTLITESESFYSWNYYRLLVQDLQSDQMQITPVEHLDKTSNETLAALSVAIPYRSSSGGLSGIFVADIFAEYFFNLIETSLAFKSRYTAGIIDQEGHFLYHSQKKNEWNRLLAESSVHTLTKEFTSAIAEQIIDTNPGLLETSNGDVIYHVPLKMGALGLQKKYYFYLLEPGKLIFSNLRKFGLIFFIAMVGFVMIAIYLSRIATLQFVRPIRQLQEGSDILSRGNFSHRLKIVTGDEIQELANRFNYMAESIEERDNRLKEINANLEEKINERTLELKDEKDKLRIILDNVPSAFVLFDSQQIVVTASSALRQFTGHSPEEAVGKKCFEIMGAISDCKNCRKNNFYNQRGIYREEFKQTEPNGKIKTYERINVPVELNSGESACLEILSDISERIRLQNQLLQSEKLASIGEMAAVIAHEIRNSLTSANMLLQLIHEANVLKEPEKESLNVALSSIEKINKVTNDLLSFSRPTEIEKSPTDLLATIQDSVVMYSHQFERDGIIFELICHDTLLKACIDQHMMNEVFSNILLNSTQAIDKNGKILVRVETKTISNENIDIIPFSTGLTNSEQKEGSGSQQITGMFQITFEDNGPGCPPEYLSKIFDPFYTTKINGTGLGLALAKRVVEAHGGQIFAENTLGKGMKIIILLPENGSVL